MKESETRPKASTSGENETQKPRLEAEGLATELLWTAQTKAAAVAIVMNDEYGPGPSGIADDFGVAVEMALKARLVFTECGPWKNTDGHRAMEAALKFKLGHKADVILRRLPPKDIEAIKKLYEDCVDAHRRVRLPPGPHVDWTDFNSFIKWVGQAVDERYKSGGPEIRLPVGRAVRPDPQAGTAEIPSFADRLIEWVTEPMDRLQSGRTLREMLKANRNIAAARTAEPAPGLWFLTNSAGETRQSRPEPLVRGGANRRKNTAFVAGTTRNTRMRAGAGTEDDDEGRSRLASDQDGPTAPDGRPGDERTDRGHRRAAGGRPQPDRRAPPPGP